MKRPPEAIARIRDRNHFPFVATELGLVGGVEIGTWKGEYASHLLTHWGGKLWVVDPWERQLEVEYRDGCNVDAMGQVMAEALATLDPWIKAGRCDVMRMKSLEAARSFTGGSLGFVYLDGNHREEVVAAEIRLFWPLLHPGGVLCGHDAYHRDDPYQLAGVIDAVLDFAEQAGVRPHLTGCTSWWFQKP